MLVSLTVGKVDAGVTVLLTPDKRLIEFPSILLPPDISSGSIVDITVGRNTSSEVAAERSFRSLQDQIFASFGADEPARPVLRCRNATQTSVVLEWDPVQLATADLISLALYRNDQKAGNIPRPLEMHSTKISGLAVDTEYVFHLVLRTTAGTLVSERVKARTHKMTDLSGVTITTGILPPAARENLARAVSRIGARIVDGVRIDTTHFVTTEGRGVQWEKAVEMNIPVVRPEWVEACERNGRILGVTKFYLDALRPGPTEASSAASPPPVPKDKELPPHPPAETAAEQNGAGPSGGAKEGTTNGAEEEDSSEEEEEEEGQEEKVRSGGGQDEQKVRAEERDQQKMALRPGGQSSAQKATVEDGDDEGEDEDDAADEKGRKSPGGGSFQDIKL